MTLYQERYNNISEVLLKKDSFVKPDLAEDCIPSKPGVYCVKIENHQRLPEKFAQLVDNGVGIIYIGIANKSLYDRLLKNELRAIGQGTFFRSIGTVLGYLPEYGSLRDKRNQSNFRFNHADKSKIIDWINSNLLVSWIETKRDLKAVESLLIKEYKPILNIQHNPFPSNELIQLREKAIRIARGE